MPFGRNNMKIPSIILTDRQNRVRMGHPWIYRTDIHDVMGNPNDGDIVDALDRQGQFIARGYYNNNALISARVLTRKPVEIDDDFWRARLENALNHRRVRYPGRQALRLAHSDADFLPGLIVDRYGDALVAQTTTLGMDLRKDIFVRLLVQMLNPKVVYEHNESSSRDLEKLPRRRGVLFGSGDGTVNARIGRANFVFNVFDHHKTGYYLDQQQNHEITAGFITAGMRVLDGFCNMAGFGIHALLAGAGEVLAVDSSEKSLERAMEAGKLAGVSARLRCMADNMFDYLRAAQKRNEKFDFVILDPPSFSRSRKAIAEARRGYKEIHLRAFKVLQSGGQLATFCCSHHVSQTMFMQFILDAARDARVILRREAVFGAAPDHPVIASIPESEYLKGALFTILPQS